MVLDGAVGWAPVFKAGGFLLQTLKSTEGIVLIELAAWAHRKVEGAIAAHGEPIRKSFPPEGSGYFRTDWEFEPRQRVKSKWRRWFCDLRQQSTALKLHGAFHRHKKHGDSASQDPCTVILIG